MKTDIDIKDDIYAFVRDSALPGMVSGRLSKTLRPEGSTAEDIVISVLASSNAQVQEAIVNVNIYVPDLTRGSQYEEDSARLRVLCRAAGLVLGSAFGPGFRFGLEQQRVLPVEGRPEHVINNRLLYKFSKA